MGAGDWLIATAQVKQVYARTGRKVLVVGKGGRPQWSDVFEHNPKILRRPTRDCERVVNASGLRPYIVSKGETHWTWKTWDKEPGELFLAPHEIAFAAPYRGHVLIEPNTKVEGSNKAWIWERWQHLVDRGGSYIQIGRAGTRRLDRVRFVETPSFRHACAVLAVSRALVSTEGGLHHAAAALRIPAVVLFSEFISPDITGYDGHRNLRHAGAACGARMPCAGCRASMEAITVDEVDTNLREILA